MKAKEIYGYFTLEEVLSKVPAKTAKFVVDGVEYTCRLNSTKLRCFKRDINCAHCELKGEFFALEKTDTKAKNPHMNMYAVKKNKKVLMTQDHIIPKSKGGSNDMSNLQTMCYPCNQKKKDKILQELREERKAKRLARKQK